jgi:succinyl-CoA synthetase beta subunit
LNLYEFQGKRIFREYGIPVPQGQVIHGPHEAVNTVQRIGVPVVMKAQILEGGRGKAGLVRSSQDEAEAHQQAQDLFSQRGKGKNVKRVLVEKKIPLRGEYYLGMAIDELNSLPVLIFGTLGGVDIEEISQSRPETLFKLFQNPWERLSLNNLGQFLTTIPLGEDIRRKLRPGCEKLSQIFFDQECILAEINPLGFSQEGDLVALDAKVIVDDNSLFRHPNLQPLEETSSDIPLENEALKKGFSYVKLDGDIGVVSHGAGLGMLVVDMIRQAGGRAANFLDIKGHEREKNRLQEIRVKNEMDIVLADASVKGILFNVFGGLTRCDEVALGLRKYLKEHKVEVPIVVRLFGTRSEMVPEILRDVDVTLINDLDRAVAEVVRLRKERS